MKAAAARGETAPDHGGRTVPWLLSLAAGCIGALALFPVPVLVGTAPFWRYPRGIVGGSWADMATALSGYEAFVRDAWRWPLFHVAGLGGDGGTNVIFTDSIPLVVLAGRWLFQATGQVVPLYGAWSGLCVVAMALASTGLVRACGARGAVAGLTAALVGVSMPPLLARWGHLSLMGQALIPLALILYVRVRAAARPPAAALLVGTAGLCVLALLIHPYLFFMVTGVAVAAILQAGLDRRLAPAAATAVFAGLGAILCGTVAAMGHLSGDASVTAGGFGVFSANLLSPIVPQFSGISPLGLSGVLDATGGQYEGFAYLGAGLLLMTVFTWGSVKRIVAGGTRRHPCLLTVVAGFTALAVSNQVYAGGVRLVSVPLPDGLLHTLGVVRASGRFAWLGIYLLAALLVVLATRRRWAVPVLLAAAGLQWADAGPLRAMIRQSVSAPADGVLDADAWRALLPKLDRIVVDPPFACLTGEADADWSREAAIQIQLLAAEAGLSTNTVYTARMRRDCALALPAGRTLTVRLRLGAQASVPFDPTVPCSSNDRVLVCSTALDRDELTTLLADPPNRTKLRSELSTCPTCRGAPPRPGPSAP